MRNSRKLATLLVAAVFGLGLAGCEKKGPAEKAGEKLDHALGTDEKGAAEKAGEQIDDAAGAVKQESQEAADKIDRAADELKK
ncbi:MAG TPA: hypothetical protein VEQ17_01405 [Steroidobacteraceae bacterium]|nr:hypothetical protein [Steroidobacteraceae bacterium]